MIPKIIHYCWFGNNEIPQERRRYIDEWADFHPGWEIKCWNEANSPMDHPYMASAFAGGHFSNMSNFIRLYALKNFGGFYLDTDIKLIKPLFGLQRHQAFFGFEEGDETAPVFWVNNAICGAEREHAFTQECFDFLISKYDGTELSNLSGPQLTTELLINKRDLKKYGFQTLDDITLYPKEVFYPIHYSEVHKINFLEKHIFPDTIAVHVWARTWLTPEILINIVDDLYAKINNREKEMMSLPVLQEAGTAAAHTAKMLSEIYQSLHSVSYDNIFIKNIIAQLLESKNKSDQVIAEKEKLLTSLQQELLALTAKTHSERGELVVLKNEVAALQKTVQEKQEELIAGKAAEEEMRRHAQTAEQELRDSSATNKRLIAESLRLQKQNEIITLEKDQLYIVSQNQKKAIQALTRTKAADRTEVARQQAVIDRLKAEQAELLSANASYRHQLKEAAEKYENIHHQLHSLNQNIAEQKAENIRLKNEIKYLTQSVGWYQNTYEKRKLAGVLKDRFLKEMQAQPLVNNWIKGYYKIEKAKRKSALSKKIFCSVVNYNYNENALALRKNLSRYFDTIILDSGSKEKDKSFVDVGNVYYTGLLNNSYRIAKEKGYTYLFFICSDVEFKNEEVDKMVRNLEHLDFNAVGLYSPCSKGRSHAFCKRVYDKGLRTIPFTEGFVFLCSLEILDQFLPVDLNVNLYGWGLDVAKGYFSKKLGKLSVIDDEVEVYHPESTGYSNNKAEDDMWHWQSTIHDEAFKNFFEKHISIIRNGHTAELTVSVIIPCYNQSDYLKETIESVLLQEYPPVEILIVDDGSTDDSSAIAKRYASVFPAIRYLKKENGGLGNARNYGLKHAQGKWIQLLDGDDTISKDKLLNQIHAISNNPSIEVSYTPYLCFEHGKPENTWTYSRVEMKGSPVLDLIKNWEKDLSIPVHCFLFKRIRFSTLFFDESLPNHEDWLFHLYIASQQPVYRFEPGGVAYYRVRLNSMARDKQAMMDGKKQCIQKALASGKFDAESVEALKDRFAES